MKFHNIVPNYYKGSKCDVLLEWENGKTTNEILKVMCTDNPVTCSIYACENFPLAKPSWKQMKNIVKQEKKFNCMTNQAKLRLYTAPELEITRTYEQAHGLDKRNGKTLWGDAIFIIKSPYTKVKTPDGFKKIQNQIAQYQSLIGALPWIATIGHFDTNTALMTMSGFHMTLRVGHLNNLNSTIRYLLMMKHAPIRVRIN
jgi:hypothetical protein